MFKWLGKLFGSKEVKNKPEPVSVTTLLDLDKWHLDVKSEREINQQNMLRSHSQASTRQALGRATRTPRKVTVAQTSTPYRDTESRRLYDDTLLNPLNPLNPFNAAQSYDDTPSHSSSSSHSDSCSSYESSSSSSYDSSSSSSDSGSCGGGGD